MNLNLLISVPLAFSCGHCFALLRVYFSVYCPFYQYCGSISQVISHFSPSQTISLAAGLLCHSCDTLKTILLQVEKPAHSLGCDYWFHHLCYLGILLKAALWSVLDFDLPWFNFHSISARHFPALVDLYVIFGSFFSLLVWGLQFFVGLILQRAFHLIWFEPTSQQY